MNLFRRTHVTAYEWEGIAPDGGKVSGELSAVSIERARNSLIRHRIQVLSLRKKRIPLTFRRPVFTANDRIVFFNQLAALLQAGLPVLQAIEVACQQHDSHPLTTIKTTLRESILAGNGLAAGLQRYPQYFDAMTCHLILAGEKTGTLDQLLERIAQHLQHMRALRRKITQACFYPCVTLCVASLVTLLMLMFMTPRFAAIFEEMHAPLPAFTRGVLLIGAGIHRLFLPVSFLIIALIGLFYHFRQTPGLHRRVDWLWLRMPLIKSVIKKIILARFARTVSTLLAAGLPLSDALGLTAPVACNHYYEKAIHALQQAIQKGRTLHHAMQENPLFSKVLQQLIEAGEESGRLINMLEKSAEFHEAEVDHTAGLLSQLLEPLIMLILGALIGTLVIAMYLPIFNLGTAI